MHSISGTLIDGIRATFLLRPRADARRADASTFLAIALAYLWCEAVSAWVGVSAPRQFLAYGVVTVLADTLLTFVASWVLVTLSGRDRIVWHVASIALVATAVSTLLVQWPLQQIIEVTYAKGFTPVALVLAWFARVWWLLVLFGLARWLTRARLLHAIPVALIAFAVSALPWYVLPGTPMFGVDGAAMARQRAAEAIGEPIEVVPAIDAEQVLYDQSRMLEAALAGLRPRTPDATNLYSIAFAGDGSENVFDNESEYVERLLAGRFGGEGRTLVMSNNPASVAMRPLATLTNLRRALAELARRMDTENDLLLVYLTSHGSEQHEFYINFEDAPLNAISPRDLADALETTPSIRWKVIIVNACFSGGFIDALRNDSTLVITAARADRPSFGCGSESDITFFGRALLAEALNETTSIPAAFERARVLVAEWEVEESIDELSEPQIATSSGIEAKLEAWRSTLPDAPAVPFEPTDRSMRIKPASDSPTGQDVPGTDSVAPASKSP